VLKSLQRRAVRFLEPTHRLAAGFRADENWASAISKTARSEQMQALPCVSHCVDFEPWIHFDRVPLEQSLEEYIGRDAWPLPDTADREGYHGDRHYDYWLSGLKDYLSIKYALRRQNLTLSQAAPVLDFGCASGRVLRHLLCNEPEVELWGADIDVRLIDWILKYLGDRPRVLHSTTLPFLPIEDNFFGLLYALSVFTHIDELELAWLCELRRILRPGGIAYVTVHTDYTWKLLGPNHKLYYMLIEQPRFNLTPESFSAPMPSERLAFKWPDQVNNSAIFFSTDYVHRVWGRFLDVVEIIREGSDYQDVVLLRKSG
jgi:SAM-dependent methyltransferase